MPIRFYKAVASLPGTLTPDTLYMVRTGAGFDLYCSDSTGSVAHALNGGGGAVDPAAVLTAGLAKPGVNNTGQSHLLWTGIGDFTSTRSVAAGLLALFPVLLPPGTYSSIRCQVTTAHASANACRMALYTSVLALPANAANLPEESRVLRTGTFSAASTGEKSVSTEGGPVQIAGGWYLAAFYNNGSAAIALAAAAANQYAVPAGFLGAGLLRAKYLYSEAGNGGDCPATLPALAGLNGFQNTGVPLLRFES